MAIKREKAIQYVYERYGKLGAAMTANVITYRGRSAAREVGKALDFDEDTLSRLAGLVHTWEWKDPNDSTERQFRMPDSICASRASGNSSSFIKWSRISRVIWDSIQAAW